MHISPGVWMVKGHLCFHDGETFSGNWLTATSKKVVEGEVAFYTGMTGFEKALTNPFYKDKLIVFTYPLIGTCGISGVDFYENKPLASGVVVYETFPETNHYAGKYTLFEYLQKWEIPLLTHIDTRAVARKVRENSMSTAAMVAGDPLFVKGGIMEKAQILLSANQKDQSNKQHGSAVAYA